MEIGIGKIYVYLCMIFELNCCYGFMKFVIVVLLIVIKEGVYKMFVIIEDYFCVLYVGVLYDYFLYDFVKFGQVCYFVVSVVIQIMVMMVVVINKKEINNFYKDSEKIGGEKLIDLICVMWLIVIVDEL